MADPWYAEGLRFNCTRCGNCCTGPPGAVWFTPEEGRAMAAAVGVSEPEFLARYARRLHDGWSLQERRSPDGMDCVFLQRDEHGLAGCGLYDARPAQCRSWPFWDENLGSKDDWEAAKCRTPCPGMGTGPLIPVEEITRRLNGDGLRP